MHIRTTTLVIGAGVGGLGAGCWLKHFGGPFVIVDGAEEVPKNLHNGVHYLHSIPELPPNLKIDIKEVLLTDGILEHGEIHSKPTLMHALKYSEKVREMQHPSSIMDVGKDEKVYMPSSNSMNELIDDMSVYIGKENFVLGWWLKEIDHVEKVATFINKNEEKLTVQYNSIISTVPMDKMLVHMKCEGGCIFDEIELKASPVHTTNFKVENIVPNWLINLYVPERYSPIYRASLLNNVCSVESMKPLDEREIHRTTPEMFFMFSLKTDGAETYTWNTGKVISISIDDRIKVVEEFRKKSIYPIGRFGLWNRKLLIDSTIKQAKQVVHYLADKDEAEWENLLEFLSR